MYYRAVILKGTLAPNVTIETSHVIGNYSEAKNVSLCGIGKQLKLCNRMEIQNAENISEGGLGILKLKGLVPASSWFGKEPQWLTIIRKYFNTDKNIVACQEELFKNGFDEYAKL